MQRLWAIRNSHGFVIVSSSREPLLDSYQASRKLTLPVRFRATHVL
jgi:hypothetical protein